MAGGANADAGVGTGGMATKLAAARIAAAAGCATLITLGRRPAPLQAVEDGARATLFAAARDARRRLQGLDRRLAGPAGRAGGRRRRGARRCGAGKSLLAAGVRRGRGPVRARATR